MYKNTVDDDAVHRVLLVFVYTKEMRKKKLNRQEIISQSKKA